MLPQLLHKSDTRIFKISQIQALIWRWDLHHTPNYRSRTVVNTLNQVDSQQDGWVWTRVLFTTVTPLSISLSLRAKHAPVHITNQEAENALGLLCKYREIFWKPNRLWFDTNKQWISGITNGTLHLLCNYASPNVQKFTFLQSQVGMTKHNHKLFVNKLSNVELHNQTNLTFLFEKQYRYNWRTCMLNWGPYAWDYVKTKSNLNFSDTMLQKVLLYLNSSKNT